MADKRIDELDQDATYAANTEVPSLVNSGAEAKRMALSVIYPKTNTLGADTIGTVNTATDLLRLDNGSGAETSFPLASSAIISTTYQISLYEVAAGSVIGTFSIIKIGSVIVYNLLPQNLIAGAPAAVAAQMKDVGGVNITLPAVLRPGINISGYNTPDGTNHNAFSVLTTGAVWVAVNSVTFSLTGAAGFSATGGTTNLTPNTAAS